MARNERLERYRSNCEKCFELAQRFDDQEQRIMLGMANAWLKLAEQHLRNSETVLAAQRLKSAKLDDSMQC